MRPGSGETKENQREEKVSFVKEAKVQVKGKNTFEWTLQIMKFPIIQFCLVSSSCLSHRSK